MNHKLLNRSERVLIVQSIYSGLIKNEIWNIDDSFLEWNEIGYREVCLQKTTKILKEIQDSEIEKRKYISKILETTGNSTENLGYTHYACLLLFIYEIENYVDYIDIESERIYNIGFFVSEIIKVFLILHEEEKERGFLHIVMDIIIKDKNIK